MDFYSIQTYQSPTLDNYKLTLTTTTPMKIEIKSNEKLHQHYVMVKHMMRNVNIYLNNDLGNQKDSFFSSPKVDLGFIKTNRHSCH